MTAWLFPGQGSQKKGMGAELFAAFPEETARATEILGWSPAELCRDDPEGLLARTDRTQPALFLVSALEVLRRRRDGVPPPAFVAGHSLGEYAALFAAEVFDLGTGLRLVMERGRLMNEARSGAMLAVMGEPLSVVRTILDELGARDIDVANHNGPAQTVLSGPQEAIAALSLALQGRGVMAIPLNVSAAFHSRLMQDAATAFEETLGNARFSAPLVPVIANVTARPYADGDAETVVRSMLTRQITGSVRWLETIRYLLARGETDFEELGPGNVLVRLLEQIRTTPLPDDAAADDPVPLLRAVSRQARPPEADQPRPAAEVARLPVRPARAPQAAGPGAQLGSAAFRRAHGLTYAYCAGAMYRGIASPGLVIAMGEAGMLGFLGTGGQDRDAITRDIRTVREALGQDRAWGVNLLADPDDPEDELARVEILLREGVRRIEASAFMRLTPAVVRFRFAGARRLPDGGAEAPNAVFAKVSRPEVAAAFMRPAAADLVESLVADGLLSEEEGWCAGRLPVAADISVEADSGGHTDQGSPYALVPAMCRLRDQLASETGFGDIRIGAGGGIGTPEAVAAALILGADYVFTGSVNQCTVEAATSDAVKDILQGLGVADFGYAPAGDMFELGARVQVVRRGLFFAARANRLFDLYRHHDCLEDLPAAVRRQLEERFFGRSLEAVWDEVRTWLERTRPELVARAQDNPKFRMAQVFRWYFHHTTELALAGDPAARVDYQIHSGPALGAFNEWARGGPMEAWRDRRVAEIGRSLMDGAASCLADRLAGFNASRNDDKPESARDALRQRP